MNEKPQRNHPHLPESTVHWLTLLVAVAHLGIAVAGLILGIGH